MNDPLLPVGTNRCLCRSCGEYFNSVGAFTFHRTGRADARTCQNPAEAGMQKNSAGFWVTERMPLKGEPKWAVSRPGNGKTATIDEKPGSGVSAAGNRSNARFQGSDA